LSDKNEKSKDVYDFYKTTVSAYFNEVLKTTASYLQAVSNLQQEIVGSWKNTIDNASVIEENFSNKSETKSNLPDIAVKMIMEELSEQINRTEEMQNKMLLVSIDAISQNSKSFNEGIKTFDELRSKIVESFISSSELSKVQIPEEITKTVPEFRKPENIDIEESPNSLMQ
jgi:hypothetical protein